MPTLLAASAVVSPPRRPFDDSPATLSYYRDLVGPFGLDVDEALLREAPHVRHQDLVELLAGADGIRDFEPDLVVVAHALPDVTPFTAVAPHLDHLLGGGSVNFGIHQQGLAAPFTALRAVSAFQRGRRSERAVLAVLEQTTLPTRFPLAHDHGLVDSGVVLALGTDGGPRLTGVETVAAARGPAGRLRELTAADPAGTLLVAGARVDRAALDEAGTAVFHAAPDTYCTGVWLALARNWHTWRADHSTVVLCDTEPRTGDTHIAVLRADAGPAAGEEGR